MNTDNVQPSATKLRVAVFIPVFNEGITIQGTVRALQRAGVPLSAIFIADDKSTDDTAAHARATGANVYTAQRNRGKAGVVQYGVHHFQLTRRYDWIIFIDGDTRVDADFYRAFVSAAEKADGRTALFVGQVASERDANAFSAARAVDYAYGQEVVKKAQSRINAIFVSPGCASMFRADVYQRLRIHRDTLAEDMDLTMQLHDLGYRAEYVAAAKVYTQDPATLRDYHKQMLRWFRGFWQVMRKYRVFKRIPTRPVEAYLWLVTLDALLFNRPAAVLLFGMPLLGLGWSMAIDAGFQFAVCCWSAWRTKRADVVWRFPAYYWLAYLNLYIYLRALVEVMLLGRNPLDWNKIARHQFQATRT